MYLAENMTPDDLDLVRHTASNAENIINHIYLHWTAGHYGQCYDDYHICIDKDGSIFIMCDDFTEVLAHTWHRNHFAVGIALCCCADATCKSDGTIDLGTEPPTAEQIESLAQVVAVLADEYCLPLYCPDYVMTHCEAAELDGYGPSTTCERWDLWYVPDYYGADGALERGGDLIRGKAAWYMQHYKHGYYEE
jgi:hypothetical protein